MTHVNILMVGRIVSETQTDRQLKFIIDIYIYIYINIYIYPPYIPTTRVRAPCQRIEEGSSFLNQMRLSHHMEAIY